MLLAIDIGNTSITFGIFRGNKLARIFRISSKNPCNVSFLKKMKGIDAAIICSVVPKLTPVIAKAIKQVSGVAPVIVGRDIKLPIKNNYKNPKQVGQDRLVDAIAAREIYGTPVIIVDSGTAITFDYISKKGEYEGGLIVPGIDISLKALYERTALLPDVKLRDDKGLTLIAKDTVNSIKSGLLNGFGSMNDGVISRIKAKHGNGKGIRVIGTGGYIGLIKKYSSSINVIDEFLTLKGLDIIYKNYLTTNLP
jgi:type III pantothenate kinase